MASKTLMRSLMTAGVTVSLALVIASCSSGDDGAENPAGIDTDEAEAILEDAMSDPEESYAEVTFQGSTVRYEGEGDFACFLTDDGGSMGSVDFNGVNADGDTVMVDWSGDSPDSAIVSLELADGTQWDTPIGASDAVKAEITEPSAEITAEVSSFNDADVGREYEQFSATVVCPSR